MSRDHRIGHNRDVCVYQLLTSKNDEVHMFHISRLSLGLYRAVLVHQHQNTEDYGSIDGNSKTKSKSKREIDIQAKEIDEILKK